MFQEYKTFVIDHSDCDDDAGGEEGGVGALGPGY